MQKELERRKYSVYEQESEFVDDLYTAYTANWTVPDVNKLAGKFVDLKSFYFFLRSLFS